MAVQQTWSRDRVYFFGDDGTMQSLPTAWTDAAEPDVFVALSAGRSAFRVDDLLSLAGVLHGLSRPRGPNTNCKANSAEA